MVTENYHIFNGVKEIKIIINFSRGLLIGVH